MANFHGLLIPLGSHDAGEVMRRLGCSADGAASGSALLVELRWTKSDADADSIARDASPAAESVLLIRAQTSADVYEITEYVAGQRVRRIGFQRDADPQWHLEGTPRKWEADLLFSLPCDEFIGFLSDDDSYTDADLEAGKRAHAAHDLDALPRRPPLLAASLREWLRSQRVDAVAPSARI